MDSGRRGNIRVHLPRVLCRETSAGSVSVLLSSCCRMLLMCDVDMSSVIGEVMSKSPLERSFDCCGFTVERGNCCSWGSESGNCIVWCDSVAGDLDSGATSLQRNAVEESARGVGIQPWIPTINEEKNFL